VLGGFSQGAVVAEFVASGTAPEGVPPAFIPAPLAPQVDERVRAVVFFGKPADQVLRKYGASSVVITEPHAAKTLSLCVPGDPICGPGGNPTAHTQYAVDGSANHAAAFAVRHL
jgi:hypothetical protein